MGSLNTSIFRFGILALLTTCFLGCVSTKKYNEYVDASKKRQREFFHEYQRLRIKYLLNVHELGSIEFHKKTSIGVNTTLGKVKDSIRMSNEEKSEKLIDSLNLLKYSTLGMQLLGLTSQLMIPNIKIDSVDRVNYLVKRYHQSIDFNLDKTRFAKNIIDPNKFDINYVNETQPYDISNIPKYNDSCKYESIIRQNYKNYRIYRGVKNEIWFFDFIKNIKSTSIGDFYLLELFIIDFKDQSNVICSVKYFECLEKRTKRIQRTVLNGNGISRLITLLDNCYE